MYTSKQMDYIYRTRTAKQTKRALYRVLALFYDEIIKCSKDEGIKETFYKLIKVNLSYGEEARDFFIFKRVYFDEMVGKIKGLSHRKEFIVNNALKSLIFFYEGGPCNAYSDKAFRAAFEEFGDEVIFDILNEGSDDESKE